jgi:hypothetical protein
MRYIVSEGLTLDGPLTTTVGLIGTPVKPYDAKRLRMTGHAGPAVPPDLRKKGFSSAKYWTGGWSNFGGGSGGEDVYYNFTPEWCEGLAKSRKDEWEKKRMYPALYIAPTCIIAETPEYACFYREWGGRYMEGLEEFMVDLSTYKGADVRPSGRPSSGDFWANRSYQDFYFYSLDKVLAAFAAEGVRAGIYVDCTFHSGDPRPYRRWVQRLHQVTRKHSPDGLIVIHMSGDRNMAIWSMVDTLAEGEQYSANWSAHMVNNPELTFNDCYPTVLPLDRVRAGFPSTMWGPLQVFLSQFWTDARQKEAEFRKENDGKQPPSFTRRFRHITGLMLVHDAAFWGEFYACGVKEDPWVKRAEWGYDDTVEFVPYWDSRGMLEAESPNKEKIVASAWFRPDGNLMIILFNDTDDAASVRLKVNARQFPVALKEFARAVDITSPVTTLNPEATEPDTYEYSEGSLEVDMRPRDFRLLVFEEQKAQ